MGARRFVLDRREDATGVSGAGIVAEGIQFSNGVIALQWLSEFPTSVVFHSRGLESVEAVHGHGGKTQIVWLDHEPMAQFPTTMEYPELDPEHGGEG